MASAAGCSQHAVPGARTALRVLLSAECCLVYLALPRGGVGNHSPQVQVGVPVETCSLVTQVKKEATARIYDRTFMFMETGVNTGRGCSLRRQAAKGRGIWGAFTGVVGWQGPPELLV